MDFNVGFNGRVNYAYDWGKLGKGNMLGGVEWNRYTLYDSEYLEGMNFKEIVRTWIEKRLYTGHEMNTDAFSRLNTTCIKIGLSMPASGMTINGEVISGHYRLFLPVCH